MAATPTPDVADCERRRAHGLRDAARVIGRSHAWTGVAAVLSLAFYSSFSAERIALHRLEMLGLRKLVPKRGLEPPLPCEN